MCYARNRKICQTHFMPRKNESEKTGAPLVTIEKNALKLFELVWTDGNIIDWSLHDC